MKLQNLLQKLDYECVCGSLETEISKICCDSRQAVSGSLFVCIKGTDYDGHDFARKAVESGASALVRAGGPANHNRHYRNERKDNDGLSCPIRFGTGGFKDRGDRHNRNYYRKRTDSFRQYDSGSASFTGISVPDG